MINRPATLTDRRLGRLLAVLGTLLLTSLLLPGLGAFARGGEGEGDPAACVPDETAGCEEPGSVGGDPGAGGDPELVQGDDGCWYDAATGEVASCEDDVEETLVLGDDGCWYHPDGVLAYCDAVEEPPVDDGGLIPGVDGCLYYPDGGLAACPDGDPPVDDGCTPNADGSDGCVIPGPVADETENSAAEPPAERGSAPVVDEPADPQPVVPAQNEAVGAQPAIVEPANVAAPFDPAAAAVRLRQAVGSFGGWLAALVLWLLGLG